MRHRERHALLDGGVIHQHDVDLDRRDLLAPAVDQLLEPAGQPQISVALEEALIAGSEPIVDERALVRLGIVLVPRRDVGAADHDFADVPARHDDAVLVHDRDFRSGGNADRPRASFARRQRVRRHLMRGLGHAVRLDDGASKRALQFLHHLRRERRGRRSDEPKAAALHLVAMPRRTRQDRLVHRRDGRVPGRPHLIQPVEEAKRVEPRRAEDLRACAERCQNGSHQTVDVEQRHDVQADVVGGQLQGSADVARGGGDVPVQQRDELRARSGSGCVQHQRDVVAFGKPTLEGARAVLHHGAQRERAGALLAVRDQLDHRDVQLRGDRARRRIEPALDHERLGMQIGEVELELVGGEAAAERRGRRGRSDGHERCGCLGSVGKHEADAVPSTDAEGIQIGNGPLHQRAELAITQRRHRFRRADCDRVVSAALQQFPDRVHICTALWT